MQISVIDIEMSVTEKPISIFEISIFDHNKDICIWIRYICISKYITFICISLKIFKLNWNPYICIWNTDILNWNTDVCISIKDICIYGWKRDISIYSRTGPRRFLHAHRSLVTNNNLTDGTVRAQTGRHTRYPLFYPFSVASRTAARVTLLQILPNSAGFAPISGGLYQFYGLVVTSYKGTYRL